MNKYSFLLIWGGILCSALFLVSFCSCSDGVTEVETTHSVNSLGQWVAPDPADTALYSEYIQDHDIYIVTDPETGVQYIVYREKAYNAGMGGLTPRLRPDGSLYVVDVEGVG